MLLEQCGCCAKKIEYVDMYPGGDPNIPELYDVCEKCWDWARDIIKKSVCEASQLSIGLYLSDR